MPTWRMKGEYVKNCNCLSSCPCDTTGFPAPHSFCEGMAAMNIKEGNFDNVDLKGLRWLAVVHWPGAMHEGNGTLEAFIDESADEEQRNALMTILTGQAGGPLFEILSQIVTSFHGPHFVKIDWSFDKDKRTARVSVPNMFETTSESLKVPATGDEQRVVVNVPNGFEYKVMEVAQTGSLKSSGAIKYDYKGTHSSLAEVEHTHEGLVA